MLFRSLAISEALETPVSTLLGETVAETKAEDLKAISEKLEIINLQLARRKDRHRKILRGACIVLCAAVILILAALFAFNSPYLNWDYSDPETAVVGVLFHAFEWLFVRLPQRLELSGKLRQRQRRNTAFLFHCVLLLINTNLPECVSFPVSLPKIPVSQSGKH